ncbi:unnamed protein product [Caenorhabditis angaria]|uniref:Uncharacterized protein n=1 Tax=Caenorhabditis angaria TaxID=860376 RepID=A0A9P1N4I5_9PELO|nr:unnamed protein product [Caenorhabditis angaria]
MSLILQLNLDILKQYLESIEKNVDTLKVKQIAYTVFAVLVAILAFVNFIMGVVRIPSMENPKTEESKK